MKAYSALGTHPNQAVRIISKADQGVARLASHLHLSLNMTKPKSDFKLSYLII